MVEGQRPGDWTCPSCSANNFSRRTECFQCQQPRYAQLSHVNILSALPMSLPHPPLLCAHHTNPPPPHPFSQCSSHTPPPTLSLNATQSWQNRTASRLHVNPLFTKPLLEVQSVINTYMIIQDSSLSSTPASHIEFTVALLCQGMCQGIHHRKGCCPRMPFCENIWRKGGVCFSTT